MLKILGVGQAHPQTVIDNAFLESLDIGTTSQLPRPEGTGLGRILQALC